MFRIWFDRCIGDRIPHNVRFTLGTDESGVSLDVQLKSWQDDAWYFRLGLFFWAPYNCMTNRFELLGNLVSVNADSRRCCSNGWGITLI